ncbi:MAG: hypothetical protein QUS14_03780 [Pyrinomonadaceae bacterium]|nr:hypothetical protein [Pyrinomonadaceae bacterium]
MRLFLFSAVFAVMACTSAFAQDAGNSGRVFWRGTVDGTVQLTIVGLSLEEKTIAGKPQAAGGYSFTARMPGEAIAVSVAKTEGRGNVTVVQQPSAENGFTAIIEIVDSKGGTGDYMLNISWK